jgi:hypothetical protein
MDVTLEDELSDLAEHFYDSNRTKYICYVYIFAVFVWIGIIYALKLYRTDLLGWFILIIPFVVFAISYGSIESVSVEIENEVFRVNYLSVGIIIVIPLLSILNRDYTGDRKQFAGILVLAIIAAMLSMIDIWVNRRTLSIVRHIRSVFQTYALSLLIFALYLYYSTMPSLAL